MLIIAAGVVLGLVAFALLPTILSFVGVLLLIALVFGGLSLLVLTAPQVALAVAVTLVLVLLVCWGRYVNKQLSTRGLWPEEPRMRRHSQIFWTAFGLLFAIIIIGGGLSRSDLRLWPEERQSVSTPLQSSVQATRH